MRLDQAPLFSLDPACSGNHLVLRSAEGEPGLNYLCEGLKRFYAQVQRDMPDIKRRLGR